MAVQPILSQGMVYAPDRIWADLVIMEMSMFPVGRYKDATDSATQRSST
jgi:phage terminase large subunit-like protein